VVKSANLPVAATGIGHLHARLALNDAKSGCGVMKLRHASLEGAAHTSATHSVDSGERQVRQPWPYGKKVKASHTRYRALGPELIQVYRQSALR